MADEAEKVVIPAVEEAANWASSSLLSDPGPQNIAWAWVTALMPEGQATGLCVRLNKF